MVHFGFRCVSVLVQLKFSVRSSLASFGFRVGPHLVHMCSRHGSDVAQTWFWLDSGSVQLGADLVHFGFD